MDTSLVVNICSMLGGMLAALCWLKRGRNEYIRYAMILLPYGALLYMMTEMHLWSATGHFLQRHLIFSAPVLLFLLGRYMLKCDWKRALLGCGIYKVISIALLALCAPFNDDPAFVCRVLFTNSVCDILFAWLLVWLCVRHTGLSGKEALLTAACITACSDCISTNLSTYMVGVVFDFPGETGLALHLILSAGWPIFLSGLVFACIMHFVHSQSWNRALCFGMIPPALTLLALVLYI